MGVGPHDLTGSGRREQFGTRQDTRGRDTALAPESLNGLPVAVLVIWALCAAGWGAVLVALRRGLAVPARGPALFAHVTTPAGVVLLFSLIGFGSLYGTIALTAEWWALLAVTGFRPERLLAAGGLGRLAAWAAAAAVLAYAAAGFVFRV
ncbi:Uncharacterised protein [Mycobacterium tuberculosis]|nr:Uncharacterised protein [Mycobacterium tuberculosis]